MARNPVQTQTVASGVDLTSDPVSMPTNRARRIVNLLADRLGVLRGNIRLVNQLPVASLQSIDGEGWYYQATIVNNTAGIPVNTLTDLLVWVTGGFLFIAQPSTDPLNLPVTNTSIVFGGVTGYAGSGAFFVNRKVRFASLQQELLMVQEGGLLLLRFYSTNTQSPVTGFYRAGIEPPASSGTYANVTLSTSGTGLTGTWGYKLTFFDERFRESSPTPVVNIALVNQGTAVAWSTVFPPPPNGYSGSRIAGAYLYRNTQGAPDTFYRIAAHTILLTDPPTGTFVANDFFANANAYDNATDASIVGGTLAPNPGENDPPHPASVICIWKSRVLLNDTTNTAVLQVSNFLSSTQFTAIPLLPAVATDGVRTTVGTDQGDPITALVDFGSYAAIFKRRTCFFLSGNSLSDFLIQPVHTRGCLSPETAVRCDNQVFFLSDDGVYAASYGGGEIVGKVSKEIEVDLLSQSQALREAAVACFVDNTYFLFVGTTCYAYSFDVLGWTTLQFGPGFELPGVNSGLIGGRVPDRPPMIPSCSVTLSESALTFDENAGSQTVTVTAGNTAPIGYTTSDTWLTVSGPSNGSGTATITVQANTTGSSRVATVGICGDIVTVTQTSSFSIVFSGLSCP